MVAIYRALLLKFACALPIVAVSCFVLFCLGFLLSMEFNDEVSHPRSRPCPMPRYRRRLLDAATGLSTTGRTASRGFSRRSGRVRFCPCGFQRPIAPRRATRNRGTVHRDCIVLGGSRESHNLAALRLHSRGRLQFGAVRALASASAQQSSRITCRHVLEERKLREQRRACN